MIHLVFLIHLLSVHTLIKKPNLDKETLSNYRPISHLSFPSKLTERVVKAWLLSHPPLYQ